VDEAVNVICGDATATQADRPTDGPHDGWSVTLFAMTSIIQLLPLPLPLLLLLLGWPAT